jgi:hypothetical protein
MRSSKRCRESIHLRGEKVINGDQRITRTPLLGRYSGKILA